MDYKQLRQYCLQRRILFEDPDFPAEARSIYFSKVDNNIVWRRPREIVQYPKYVVGDKSRFDLYQGGIGNCWYIAAVACIATKQELCQHVVPEDQGFGDDYAGIFRFYFWRFGKWIEVVIDDRLPTYRGHNLIFCHNREERNEFWAPLLEKAYAKIHGSYEALNGGWAEDAFVDFTGGIGERLSLKNKQQISPDLFKRMLHDYSMNSLLGSSIEATQETLENELPNGLVIGHAYSITKVVYLADKQGNKHKLIRLRNPWGRKEWKGSWGDKSRVWSILDENQRTRLRIDDENGEFWMSFEDWVNNFENLQLCHLPPENRLKEKHVWKESAFHGQWVKGVSAGGCGNPPYRDLYWTNPQYSIEIKGPRDHDASDNLCTMIVSLMQKHRRRRRTASRSHFTNVAMSFDLYKVKSPSHVLLDGMTYSKRALQIARRGEQYQYFREITHTFKLEPGVYVIIPSLFEVNQESQFLLRCFTEQEADSVEMDSPTEPVVVPKRTDDVIQQLFHKYAGDDHVVDAKELQLILNEAFDAELQEGDKFDLESCRSLHSMMDENKSGVLEWDEVHKMWTELNVWREVFKQFDKDNSGSIDTKELKSMFHNIGYSLSRGVLTSIVRRYGGKNGTLSFNDFIIVVCKVVVHMKIFVEHSRERGLKGSAKFHLHDYMESVLYI